MSFGEFSFKTPHHFKNGGHMGEIRRGSIVFHDREDTTTYLGDTSDLKKFKSEVLARLAKIESQLKYLSEKQSKVSEVKKE
jgi:hypothetical protein